MVAIVRELFIQKLMSSEYFDYVAVRALWWSFGTPKNALVVLKVIACR